MTIAKACQNCSHVLKYTPKGEIAGHLICKRNPPQMLVVMTPQGPAVQTTFPPVGADMWCDGFKTRLIMVGGDAYQPELGLGPLREESGNALS